MATSSLVLELQRLAVDDPKSLPELLRNSLLVATKLSLTDFRSWVNHELNGYPSEGELPPYRYISTQLKLRNPYHGLIPFVIDDNDMMNKICRVPLMQAIGGLTDLLESPQSQKQSLVMPMSPSLTASLMEIQGGYSQLEPVRTFGRNQIAGILDAVRTTVLNWSLELEAEGILGKGMTFSEKEKEKAHGTQNVNIQNFQGIIGNVTGSNVKQDLDMNVKAGDFQSLSKQLSANGVSAADIESLQQAIATDPKPEKSDQFGPDVSSWMGSMVAKAASGVWQIGVGTASQLLGTVLCAYYGLARTGP